MASVSGSKLAFFAPPLGGAVNLVTASTPQVNAGLVTVAGATNIEIFTGTFDPTKNFDTNFVAGAALQNATVSNDTVSGGGVATVGGTITQTEQLLAGNYTVVDETGNETLLIAQNGLGPTVNSNITVAGSSGDTIVGSPFANDTTLIDASGANQLTIPGPETITGGAGPTTVWAATGDNITGGAGSLFVAGNGGNNMQITGGSGNLTAFNFGTGNTVTGSSSGTSVINDAYGGGSNTITGGAGATTVFAGIGDTISRGAGALTLEDRQRGSTSTVTGFNIATDDIQTNSFIGFFLGTSKSDGMGGTILTFADGSTINLVKYNPDNVGLIKFTP
jgi:serralysin